MLVRGTVVRGRTTNQGEAARLRP